MAQQVVEDVLVREVSHSDALIETLRNKVFSKKDLVEICREDKGPYWRTFECRIASIHDQVCRTVDRKVKCIEMSIRFQRRYDNS